MQRKNFVNIFELKKRVDSLLDLLQEKGVLTSEEAIGLLEPDENQPRKPQPAKRKPTANRTGNSRSSSREAQKTPVRGHGQETTAHGHLAGTVYDRATGKPVVGVNVILKRSQPGAEPLRYRQTKSDMEGRFFFLNLPLVRAADGNGAAGDFKYSLEMIYRKDSFSGSGEIRLTSDTTAVQDLYLDLKTG